MTNHMRSERWVGLLFTRVEVEALCMFCVGIDGRGRFPFERSVIANETLALGDSAWCQVDWCV